MNFEVRNITMRGRLRLKVGTTWTLKETQLILQTDQTKFFYVNNKRKIIYTKTVKEVLVSFITNETEVMDTLIRLFLESFLR